MKLVVFSDAHGNETLIERIITFNPNADYYISLGDTELKLSYLLDLDIVAIKGNYPRDPGFCYESVMEIENKKVFLTHGHKYSVRTDLKKLMNHGFDKEYDIILYGHTHIARKDKVNTLLLINPGSIQSPKDNKPPSYVVLTITKDKVDVVFRNAATNMLIDRL